MVNITARREGFSLPTRAPEQNKVVIGTIFEWYDFYLYAVLAPFFAPLFFPLGNDTSALLSAFALYAAGFLARPFGAVMFGRIGDLVGRKYTFLITIVLMGLSTFGIGLLPVYDDIGSLAPILLVALRLIQGLALGGEYGAAAIYVAEHAEQGRRGFATGWIQMTATAGLLLALVVVGGCRVIFQEDAFNATGVFAAWRYPFLLSIVLLVLSVYIRLKLNESPVFARMKAEGRGSKTPIRDSFLHYSNAKVVLLTLLGATAGQGVVWYTSQLYTLFFLENYQKVDLITAFQLIGLALVLAMPFFVFFGWLSDKIGRLKIILAGCLLAAATYMPLFDLLAQSVNPALYTFQQKHELTLATDLKSCNIHIFPVASTVYSECDKAKDTLTGAGLSFKTVQNEPGKLSFLAFGGKTVDASNKQKVAVDGKEFETWQLEWVAALHEAGAPNKADPHAINWFKAVGVLWLMVLYVTMVYGPLAAYLAELFPTRIRYTSMSLPYHIGNGWFGGMLPLVATATVAWTGNIYAGLWYPIIVSVMTLIIGTLFLRDRMNRDMFDD